MINYKIRKRNTPIATLIKQYTDKKSGKVSDSRREIQRRFDCLDWKDQKKILMEFLDSCPSDREWAYGKLYALWDEAFVPKVRQVWETYREPRCAWSVIRFFPVAYIKDNLDMFTGPRDYYFICLRMVEENEDFAVDRSRLTAYDYLSILYHQGGTISSGEARDLLFMIVHDLCVRGFSQNDMRMVYNMDEVVTPNEFRQIDQARYYLFTLGDRKAIEAFARWNEEVRHHILCSPEYKTLKEGVTSIFELQQRHLTMLRKYAYLALDDKYKKPGECDFLEEEHSLDEERSLKEERSLEEERPLDGEPLDLGALVAENSAIKNLVDTFDLESV